MICSAYAFILTPYGEKRMRIFDIFFSKISIYRRLRGGVWVKLYSKTLHAENWFRNIKPNDTEVLLDSENYTK